MQGDMPDGSFSEVELERLATEAVATLALGAICRTALGDVELRPIMDGSELIAELSAKPKVS